ncbi:diaminopimelate decarboxylase [Pseudoclavibacter chungangensis]|uniref:Diaminopimelate decarboxylase n=1 Tax=Pseudoclavibacter chungangensis TaxID=587635 RepID=A0A7J5BSU0_9MICO|nr:diaminopimelate decarboxylase [Pseudoclavibacter chungangensis]KAB1657363.1 diaminopimelate decarboxylase [Pseudoclavibacter chungangensis]
MADNPLAPEWLTTPSDPNDLPDGVWPSSAHRDADGTLVVGGVRVDELAERFGTPLYVVDEGEFRERASSALSAFRDAFAAIGGEARVYYAGKALLTIDVARWATEEGLAVDTASEGELTVALRAGVPAERIGLHGNNKSDRALNLATSAGIGTVVLDSFQEVPRVAAAATCNGVVQNVRIRVNSGVHASTHDYLATAHEDQKFGVPLDQVEAIAADVRAEPSLRLLGLHAHIGSQIFDGDGFHESARRLLAVHARLLADGDLPELNLGGGFGIAYTAADAPRPLAEIADGLARFVAAECARLDIPVPLVGFEPGRRIAGPAGVTLYRTGTTKPVEVPTEDGAATRLYVSVDGGMSDNARPALYGADYSVRIADRSSDEPPALVRVVGMHCESGDIVVLADYLPGDVQPGDLLAVPATGAYCWAMSSNYNSVPRPGIVAVRDGRARVIVRGETIDDLMARDTGAPAPTKEHP